MIEWNDVVKKQPERSGRYLVVLEFYRSNGLEPRYDIEILWFWKELSWWGLEEGGYWQSGSDFSDRISFWAELNLPVQLQEVLSSWRHHGK